MKRSCPRGPGLRIVLLAAALLGPVAACTRPGQPAPVLRHAGGQGLRQLDAGTATLSCGTDCADEWRRSLPELDGFRGSSRWTQLGLRVLQIDHRQDLGYFYLARAAEGLGLRAAALRYDREAADLATGPDADARCAALPQRCNGVSLPADSLAHIQLANAARAAADRRRRTPSRAPGPPRPEATDPSDSWVDPAPVTP